MTAAAALDTAHPLDVAPDLTLTFNHRSALRRIQRGESVGDLAHLLGDLYLHELIRDDAVGPALTDAGLIVLERAPTVRQERPRLVSKPLPSGWRRDGYMLRHDEARFSIDTERVTADIDTHIAQQRSLCAALEWVAHERAVAAQDGAS